MASMLFGSAFIVARSRERKLQREIAQAAGIDPSYLASIECGRRKAPNSETTYRLISALNATKHQEQKLHALAVADRLLDTTEEYAEEDVAAARMRKLLRQVAYFGNKEWSSLDAAVFAITHLMNQYQEEII
ncbi:helix-turn-helix domain-containing protein [Duganella qianjiadongensis]|uniref:Helix-turn-helix domain-containing protein n=1 Tax=Duganella qianjiadongensis TaxID=2692176 RepID=A0ABW9VQP4_9BURK|nr:helix-turn-helix domain-containing protein [Duganella qianjiadongensis]MYM41907.1 helix-turn-helix domain-containing protein [Duganella qianjiadongensis]